MELTQKTNEVKLLWEIGERVLVLIYFNKLHLLEHRDLTGSALFVSMM